MSDTKQIVSLTIGIVGIWYSAVIMFVVLTGVGDLMIAYLVPNVVWGIYCFCASKQANKQVSVPVAPMQEVLIESERVQV